MSDDQGDTVTTIQPVKVIYCDKCGMPPEFCEYGPDFERECIPWLKKAHPDLWSKIKAQLNGCTGDDGAGAGCDEDPVSDDDRPTAPWTIEERLTAFYEKYQPDKVSDVPSLLEKYAGKEDKLFVALSKKYGPEPEDPYYDDDDDEDDGDDIADSVEDLQLAGDGKKRRGVKAKKLAVVETKVIVKKELQKKRKALTIVSGMETVPNLKLKDVAKAFSKKFAGSSSVKDAQKGGQGKEIILQGDHLEGVAEMIVKEFKVKGSNVWLDFDGDVVQYG